MPQGELSQVLRDVTNPEDKRLLVGPLTLDDAGVVLLGEEEGLPPGVRLALVQTVDFFPPVLDDPGMYGAIAAANSLSDVYAMAGRPFSALSLAGFPRGFDRDWMREILLGGNRKINEAGAILAGGHTVESDVQFGYAVTGLVDPERIGTNAGAQAGDVAYLTKPLGMGVMTTAAKFKKIDWDTMKPAAEQMATLNNLAADAMKCVNFHACTDITGFGLVGHGLNIAKASDLTFRVRSSEVPIFDGVLELAKRGLYSGGVKSGRAALGDKVRTGAGVNPERANLFFDAETSGGLLIVIHPDEASRLEDELKQRGLPVCHVGEFAPYDGKYIDLL